MRMNDPTYAALRYHVIGRVFVALDAKIGIVESEVVNSTVYATVVGATMSASRDATIIATTEAVGRLVA